MNENHQRERVGVLSLNYHVTFHHHHYATKRGSLYIFMVNHCESALANALVIKH